MGIKCDKCDREFMDTKALDQHSQAKHSENVQQAPSSQVLKRIERKEEKKAERAAGLKAESRGKFLKYGSFFAVIILIGYGITVFSSPSGNSVAVQPNPKIPTGPIHWHPELIIKINGQQQVIPANIGISPTIHQPVHTHEDELVDGARLIHLENNKPTADNMKLGFFFQVWGKKFNKDCVFEQCNTGDKKVKMTVNGKENLEFENYFMQDKDKIVIEYS